MSVKFSQNNININKYVMQPARVKANLWTGENTSVLQPANNTLLIPQPNISMQPQILHQNSSLQQPISQQENKIPKSSKTKRIIIGLGMGAVALCGLGFFAVSPKGQYVLGNIGKKGIKNFLENEKDENLKNAIDFICQNTELKPQVDKWGYRNIRKIAQIVQNIGVRDLICKDGIANIVKQTALSDGKYDLTKIIDFNKKSGFGLYNEFLRSHAYCNFNQKLTYGILDAAKKGNEAISICSTNPSENISILKGLIRTELKKHGDKWSICIAVPQNDDGTVKLYSTLMTEQLLKQIDSDITGGFSEFLRKFNGNNDSSVLRFDNFLNLLE